MKILKKISVATVCGLSKAFFKNLTGEVVLMRLVGVARSYELGTSQYGEFFKFKGDFQATNVQDGEVAVSPVCFLPQPVDGLLKAQLDELGNDGKTPVEFAFDISVVPDEKTEVGFQYRVNQLIEAKESNPLSELAGRINSVKSLPAPAPKVDPTPAPEAAPEASKAPADDAGEQHADTKGDKVRGKK